MDLKPDCSTRIKSIYLFYCKVCTRVVGRPWSRETLIPSFPDVGTSLLHWRPVDRGPRLTPSATHLHLPKRPKPYNPPPWPPQAQHAPPTRDPESLSKSVAAILITVIVPAPSSHFSSHSRTRHLDCKTSYRIPYRIPHPQL